MADNRIPLAEIESVADDVMRSLLGPRNNCTLVPYGERMVELPCSDEECEICGQEGCDYMPQEHCQYCQQAGVFCECIKCSECSQLIPDDEFYSVARLVPGLVLHRFTYDTGRRVEKVFCKACQESGGDMSTRDLVAAEHDFEAYQRHVQAQAAFLASLQSSVRLGGAA